MLATAGPRATQSKFRLLYFGADLELIAAVRQVLTRPGYRLVTCSNYENAILFLGSEIPYDLLLIDFEWRRKEGLKLARRARSLRHRKRMPIVLVAATEPNSDAKIMAQKARVPEMMMKTGDIGEAIAKIVPQRSKNGD
jgi:DNA-binding response OmpR family regulator